MSAAKRFSRRDIVKIVLNGNKPPYTPWSFKFTVEAKEKLVEHFGNDDLDGVSKEV